MSQFRYPTWRPGDCTREILTGGEERVTCHLKQQDADKKPAGEVVVTLRGKWNEKLIVSGEPSLIGEVEDVQVVPVEGASPEVILGMELLRNLIEVKRYIRFNPKYLEFFATAEDFGRATQLLGI